MVTDGNHKRRTLSILLAVLQLTIGLIAIRPVTAQTPTTYYVDARSGSDRNNGKSASAAWRTIAQANALVQPGDTVLIYSGTYQEPIAPAQSGTAQARITYRAAPGQTVIITGVEVLLNLIERSYITVQGITFQNGTGEWGEIQRGHYNEVIGNTFTANGSSPYYAGLYLFYGSSYNKILNNLFQNWGDQPNYWGNAVGVGRSADHNLIEGNRFINAGHALLAIETSFNVIRQNYFENAWQKGIDMDWRMNPPWAPGEEFVARRNLIEHNTFVRCRIGADGQRGGAGVQMGSAETIFRHNVLIENERTGVIINGWADAPKPYGNRLYNNTFVNNGTATDNLQASAVFITQWGYREVDISNNVLKNNIFYKSDTQNNQLLVDLYPWENFDAQYYQSYMIAGNTVSRTPTVNIKSLEGAQSVMYYQQRYPQFVEENLTADPRFANAAAGNYQLTSESSCIDAGVPLTNTVSAGSGMVVPVEDASYFTDGFGLVPGDQVKVGSNPAVLVVGVDINRDTLTLERAIAWTRGDPVYLGEFSGRGPDIGAFEFGSAPPPSSSSITVLTPNGGEQWTVGQMATIRWSSVKVTGKVRIEVSRDGGANFETLFANADNDGVQDWLVSGAATSSAVIRITSNENLSVADISDGVFNISDSAPPPSQPFIIVVTPNGGENWSVNRAQTILWRSTGITGAVRIRLSRDGGRTYRVLFDSVPDTGSVQWVVMGTTSTQCKIEVLSLHNSAIRDQSDGVFTIRP
ncbi:MAG: right-handed parallel beta-helix repeat-containing protein [Acidobacteria bacterium]|nr:right-handed parallel beta-helix repeat-containing protein [Acidobacteriota bacterium]